VPGKPPFRFFGGSLLLLLLLVDVLLLLLLESVLYCLALLWEAVLYCPKPRLLLLLPPTAVLYCFGQPRLLLLLLLLLKSVLHSLELHRLLLKKLGRLPAEPYSMLAACSACQSRP
jgi:hypothetical protein